MISKDEHETTRTIFNQLRSVTLVLAVISIASLSACEQGRRGTARAEPTGEIHLLLFGNHPLLLRVAEGVEHGYKEAMRHAGYDTSRVRFVRHDAGFQPTEAVAQARRVAAASPLAIVALGTPSIQAARSRGRHRLPARRR